VVHAGEQLIHHTAVRHPLATTAVYAPAMFGLGFSITHAAGGRVEHALVVGGLFSAKAIANVVAAKYAHKLGPNAWAALKRRLSRQ
jgi:hypothetical protein